MTEEVKLHRALERIADELESSESTFTQGCTIRKFYKDTRSQIDDLRACVTQLRGELRLLAMIVRPHPPAGLTAEVVTAMAEVMGEKGYHVTYGKPLYALAEYLTKIERAHGGVK